MVGEVFHIKDTSFRMLPNPTVYYWEPNTFSLPTLTSNIVVLLRAIQSESTLMGESDQISQLLDWCSQSTEKTENPTNASINTDISGTPPPNKIVHLRAGIELCDRYLNEIDTVMVYQVVRVHIQEVMAMLNEKTDTKDRSDDLAGSGPGDESHDSITISDIDSASVDEKHHLLAQIYCESVRRNVIRTVYKQRSRYSQKTIIQTAIAEDITDSETIMKRDINQIWCTLMFRMLYWLQLHDFHKKDIQVSKGDAYDSRIPVYIL